MVEAQTFGAGHEQLSQHQKGCTRGGFLIHTAQWLAATMILSLFACLPATGQSDASAGSSTTDAGVQVDTAVLTELSGRIRVHTAAGEQDWTSDVGTHVRIVASRDSQDGGAAVVEIGSAPVRSDGTFSVPLAPPPTESLALPLGCGEGCSLTIEPSSARWTAPSIVLTDSAGANARSLGWYGEGNCGETIRVQLIYADTSTSVRGELLANTPQQTYVHEIDASPGWNAIHDQLKDCDPFTWIRRQGVPSGTQFHAF
ncbi:MAG: hypothetical protein AB2A00_10515 [Myxococcota bacterium]